MKVKTKLRLQTRDTVVKLPTALKNKVNNLCSAQGVNLNKESLASENGLRTVLVMQFDLLANRKLKIIVAHRRAGGHDRRGRLETGSRPDSRAIDGWLCLSGRSLNGSDSWVAMNEVRVHRSMFDAAR